ncbi:MAG TPA: E2/UBC family protein [Pilimelia sp.]|nr:E2/UBC family protein [Pilimelia sp.]
MLPSDDMAFLNDREITYTLHQEGGMICVVLQSWPVPSGYRQTETDLLLRLAPGYPDVPPDMWWCDPPLFLADGTRPQATEVTESYLGRTWQRWSRHFQANQWQAHVDGLESYLARVRGEIARSARRAA